MTTKDEAEAGAGAAPPEPGSGAADDDDNNKPKDELANGTAGGDPDASTNNNNNAKNETADLGAMERLSLQDKNDAGGAAEAGSAEANSKSDKAQPAEEQQAAGGNSSAKLTATEIAAQAASDALHTLQAEAGGGPGSASAQVQATTTGSSKAAAASATEKDTASAAERQAREAAATAAVAATAAEEEGEEEEDEEEDEDEEEEESSEMSGSDEDGSWISWFCSLRGNEFFCEVDEDYIQDAFNLTGLNGLVPYYDYALDMVLDVEIPMEDSLTEEQQEIVESAAEMLYGLIHARYIVTNRGMHAMYEKYRTASFGRCPHVFCQGQPVLPVGLSDLPRNYTVNVFCPRCHGLYFPKSTRQANVDGAYYGTTFPHLFLMTHPDLIPNKPTQQYRPRVYGFKIHQTSLYHRNHDATPEERAAAGGGGGASSSRRGGGSRGGSRGSNQNNADRRRAAAAAAAAAKAGGGAGGGTSGGRKGTSR